MKGSRSRLQLTSRIGVPYVSFPGWAGKTPQGSMALGGRSRQDTECAPHSLPPVRLHRPQVHWNWVWVAGRAAGQRWHLLHLSGNASLGFLFSPPVQAVPAAPATLICLGSFYPAPILALNFGQVIHISPLNSRTRSWQFFCIGRKAGSSSVLECRLQTSHAGFKAGKGHSFLATLM